MRCQGYHLFRICDRQGSHGVKPWPLTAAASRNLQPGRQTAGKTHTAFCWSPSQPGGVFQWTGLDSGRRRGGPALPHPRHPNTHARTHTSRNVQYVPRESAGCVQPFVSLDCMTTHTIPPSYETTQYVFSLRRRGGAAGRVTCVSCFLPVIGDRPGLVGGQGGLLRRGSWLVIPCVCASAVPSNASLETVTVSAPPCATSDKRRQGVTGPGRDGERPSRVYVLRSTVCVCAWDNPILARSRDWDTGEAR